MPQRTGKQIRDRFLNALDDNLKKDINKDLYKKWLFYNEVRGEIEVLRLEKNGATQSF